jgi:RNA polymerase sigma factor (sigma-70 family)
MLDDQALLRRYVESWDEAAFSELVRRHIDGVYSMARRRVGRDEHLAADIAQQVFLVLARQAGRLVTHPTLVGWLHTTTRNTAANAIRAEHRRRISEQEAQAMHETETNADQSADWKAIAPLLEEALDTLRGDDRLAILLRFIERRTFAEIGATLRVGEEAARKRVERSLEKLRLALGCRGLTSTASALAVTLTSHAVASAPAGLSATVSSAALSAGASTGPALTLLVLMSTTKVQFSIVSGLLLAAALGVLWQQQVHARSRDELVTVRQQSRESARLRAENARLATANNSGPGQRRDDLTPLRAEAEALRRQIAGARSAALAPGLIASEKWRNVGRATPGEALETLLWAAENGDIPTVGRMVGFDARTRLEADAIFMEMPDVLRKAGDVTSVEEMVGLAWVMGAQLAGAEMVGVNPSAPDATDKVDDITFRVSLQKRDGTLRLQEMQFHRTPDGWQWTLSHRNLDFVGAGIGRYTKHILDKK